MKVRLPYRMTSKENKAMMDEINRQIVDRDEAYSMDFDATVLWVLHVCFGFGEVRLRRFWDMFIKQHQELRDFYLLDPSDDGWLCRYKLKQIGVDVEQWYKEQEKN